MYSPLRVDLGGMTMVEVCWLRDVVNWDGAGNYGGELTIAIDAVAKTGN